jgi:hypothetical protein
MSVVPIVMRVGRLVFHRLMVMLGNNAGFQQMQHQVSTPHQHPGDVTAAKHKDTSGAPMKDMAQPQTPNRFRL